MKPKYSLLLDEDGGIIDDLMATRRGEDFYVVVNGATKHGDIDSHANAACRGDVVVDHMKEQALLALQGPRAAEVLETHRPRRRRARLHAGRAVPLAAASQLWISRSGYTGEDGFEISVPAIAAAAAGRLRSSPTSWSSRSASARAIRCGSKPGCRSTATTSTARRRR